MALKIETSRALYKFLIRETRKLPKEASTFYKDSIKRVSAISHIWSMPSYINSIRYKFSQTSNCFSVFNFKGRIEMSHVSFSRIKLGTRVLNWTRRVWRLWGCQRPDFLGDGSGLLFHTEKIMRQIMLLLLNSKLPSVTFLISVK